MAANAGVIQIHGKDYKTVAYRLSAFRDQHPDWTIKTEIVGSDENTVTMRSSIFNGETLISTGHALEDKNLNRINSVSHVEVCETSAIGRALAFVHGDYLGSSVSSADELVGAMNQQNEKDLYQQFSRHMQAVHRHQDSLTAIRNFLIEENLSAALEAWREIGEDDMRLLWRATTKGGWFTTKERKQLDQASTEESTTRKNNATKTAI